MEEYVNPFANETMEEKRKRFESLAIPAVDSLYRLAMKYTNNPDDAQDLVQDTFERGFKAFDSFRPGSNFEAWMTTIEKNAFFNQYAKMKRRPKRANGSTGEYDDWDIYAASGHTAAGLKSAEQEYLEAFAPAEIMAALDKLSPERRRVFIDAAIDGKPYKQVAEEHSIKIGTVMSRLNRARTQLRNELEHYARERGYEAPKPQIGEDGAPVPRRRGRPPKTKAAATTTPKKPAKSAAKPNTKSQADAARVVKKPGRADTTPNKAATKWIDPDNAPAIKTPDLKTTKDRIGEAATAAATGEEA
ncbi:sigma-70 family RNA polymerase sigma factor [Bifidobacterium choloepi]|uniref:sigma-70 family RNA polymerase sigma factor n=1 Tax=Bifidobacterium choloepi TaxID=2614131 RepID=UPI001E572D90|nr:sigma-70 family RNA polymerase sigma factor [Bifidobacterium choloepi]